LDVAAVHVSPDVDDSTEFVGPRVDELGSRLSLVRVVGHVELARGLLELVLHLQIHNQHAVKPCTAQSYGHLDLSTQVVFD
jgi:hypothetical protein